MEDHVIVVGLGFGDEGKGATVDAFTKTGDYDLVVRFNGGQQAEHSVINNGRHHKFNQFGSGILNGVPSHTSRFCTFDPLMFNREAAGLSNLITEDPYSMHSVDPRTKITTPLHVMANHEQEKLNGHGTVGVGFGETIRHSLEADNFLTMGDLKIHPAKIQYKLLTLVDWFRDQGLITDLIDTQAMAQDLFEFGSYITVTNDEDLVDPQSKRLLFEGAQGVLLDEYYGFHPNTTWSRTVQHNAKLLMGDKASSVVGVTRTYHTRHGAGPLQGEGLFKDAPKELHNGDSGIQGSFRTAGFSLPLFEYALSKVSPDYTSVTHLDVAESVPVINGRAIPSMPEYVLTQLSEEDVHLFTHGAGLASVEDTHLREVAASLSPLDFIQSYTNVVLTSDGPNDTDRRWV